ncbi:DUF2786 domain-containing protein [Pseudonocardia humida]|uniref:DUF2786 domain-containing protein n=1 Tax=Pseudonocardia humida TaxID=2800819 RepID=A0ABT1A6Z8_9PSEU|nr:DUF2786 domain-containing protein [Pseudonocardia humida]MCO1658798.1 DUF2786 domain-containing protein [Pseudonocardia humida]
MGFDKLEVVRKLLAKAERAATPEEAASYTDKAVQLSARHGIDAALLAAADPGRDHPRAQRIPVHDPYSAGKARLLAWTATALGCRAVLHQARGGRVGAVSVVGFAADRERVELLYTSLLLQAGAQLARQRPPAGESVAAYRRSWLHGFAVQVHRRLSEAERGAAEAGPGPGAPTSTAVALAERAARVESAFAAAFPAPEPARGRSLSGSGYGPGTAAGERADLGGTGLAARPRGRIGA